MHFFAPLQWNGECYSAELDVIIQGYLPPTFVFQYWPGAHVPHPSHTTLVMDEVTLTVVWFNGTWRPGLFSGAGHGPSF